MEQFIDKELEVLFEKHHENEVTGYTSNYLKVQVLGNETIENTIQKVRIDAIKDEHLLVGHVITR